MTYGYATVATIPPDAVDPDALRWATLTAQMSKPEAMDFAAYVFDLEFDTGDLPGAMSFYRLDTSDGTLTCSACGVRPVIGNGCGCAL